MGDMSSPAWLEEIQWDANGLVPAIAQEASTGKVLMLAWMNRESLALTLSTARAVYWSRSRQRLWRKGEESGHEQIIVDLRLDCDKDALLLRVEQRGGIACHTGREHCFFHQLKNEQWTVVETVRKAESDIYSASHSK